MAGGSRHYRAYVGPPDQFDFMGATQFRLLTTLGLREHHSVLDFGCGSLALAAFSFPISCPDATMGSNRTAGLLKMELVDS